VVPAAAQAAPVGSSGPAADTGLAAGITDAVNATRAQSGRRVLQVSAQLSRAALQHALSMASRGYFSHSSPDGESVGQRLGQTYTRRGSHRWSVGETMVWSTRALTPAGAIAMWLASPTHRHTMLARRFREIGVAAVRIANAPGWFGGRSVTLVVADYGVR
jgi:uncharacterized protein YkwD